MCTYWCTERRASGSAGSPERIDYRSARSRPLCMCTGRSCCHKIFRSIRRHDRRRLWTNKAKRLVSTKRPVQCRLRNQFAFGRLDRGSTPKSAFDALTTNLQASQSSIRTQFCFRQWKHMGKVFPTHIDIKRTSTRCYELVWTFSVKTDFFLVCWGLWRGQKYVRKRSSFIFNENCFWSLCFGFERCGVCVRWADFINFQDIGKISQASEQLLTVHVSSVVTVYESPECRN